MADQDTKAQDGVVTPSTTYDLKYLAILPHSPEGATKTPYDISALFQEINIFQDMGADFKGGSPSMTASILINEGWDILDTMPILGGEEVVISFRTPAVSEYTVLSFRVSRVGLVADETNSSSKKAFWLHLVTSDAYRDSMIRKSIGMSGTYAEMAAGLWPNLESTRPFIDIDVTYGMQERFAVPLWPVLKSIAYMAKRSFDEDFMPFVFYEDFTGYHFKSMGVLFNQGREDLTAAQKVENTQNKKFFRDPHDAPLLQDGVFNSERFMRNIIKAEKKMARDQYSANYYDVLAVNELIYNYETKELIPTQRVYGDWFAETPHMDQFPLYSDQYDRQNTRFIETQKDNSEQVDYARRVINFGLSSTVMRLLLVGDNRINVGQVYYIEDMSNRPKQNDNIAELSKLTTGHYIITKVRHQISKLNQRYQCIAEVCKDSMSEQVLPPQVGQTVPSQPSPTVIDKGQSQKT